MGSYCRADEPTIYRTMHIVIATGIFPPEIGGPATYAQFLLDYEKDIGIEPVIVTYGKKRTDQDPRVRVISHSLPKGIRHIAYRKELIDQLRFSQSRIIYAVDSSLGVVSVARSAAAATGAKLLVRVTGDYAWEQSRQRFGVQEGIDGFQRRRYGFIVEKFRSSTYNAVRSADWVIAPSEYLKKLTIGWGVDSQRITVIPNPVTVYPLSVNARDADRKKLEITGKIILSAGRFVPWKGFRELIQIFPSIRSEFKNATLVLIGDGPERHSLESEAEKSGVREAIRFTGSLSKIQLIEWLSATDLFVLNSTYEGLSHQLIEAVGGFGLSAVVTDAGGNAEVQAEFPDRITLVRPGDKTELIKTILAILKNPAARVRPKQGAGKFSLGAVARELQRFFSTL